MNVIKQPSDTLNEFYTARGNLFCYYRAPVFDEVVNMECRLGCGACCIAPSISSPIPGMPKGKPAGMRCVQLNEANLCKLFGKPERPKVCHEFKPCPVVCGSTNQQAIDNITELESLT